MSIIELLREGPRALRGVGKCLIRKVAQKASRDNACSRLVFRGGETVGQGCRLWHIYTVKEMMQRVRLAKSNICYGEWVNEMDNDYMAND